MGLLLAMTGAFPSLVEYSKGKFALFFYFSLIFLTDVMKFLYIFSDDSREEIFIFYLLLKDESM